MSLFTRLFSNQNTSQPLVQSTLSLPSEAVVAISPGATITDIDLGTEYEDYLATQTVTDADVDGNPVFLTTYISDPVEHNGTISSPTGYSMIADADPLDVAGTQEFNMRNFASAVDNAGYGVILQDFENDGLGSGCIDFRRAA